MATRYRLSRLAVADITTILRASEGQHGTAAPTRYRALLAATFRRIAENPTSLPAAQHNDLPAGLRSLHIRRGQSRSQEDRVNQPVHVVYNRAVRSDLIEIVRVLHERLEPPRHIGPDVA